MPAKLSTHVLDLTTGRPAAGMKIDLRRLGTDAAHVKTVTTNADGRTENPLLAADAMVEGPYELVFHVRAYFRAARNARFSMKCRCGLSSRIRRRPITCRCS